MYSIGQISMILGVSTRTLRYYDNIGLLKPEYINSQNGYRFYNKKQIGHIKKILKLKDAGLSLNEIKNIFLETNNKKYNEILEKRSEIIKKEIEELKKMLFNLDKLKNKDEKENNCKDNNFEIKTRDLLPFRAIFKDKILNIKNVGELVGELYEEVSKQGLKSLDSHFIKYNRRDCNLDNADIRLFIPIESEGFEGSIYIEGGKYLSVTVYSIAQKEQGYQSIIDWINENKIEVEESPLEKYFIKDGIFNIEILFKIK